MTPETKTMILYLRGWSARLRTTERGPTVLMLNIVKEMDAEADRLEKEG